MRDVLSRWGGGLAVGGGRPQLSDGPWCAVPPLLGGTWGVGRDSVPPLPRFRWTCSWKQLRTERVTP